MAEAELEYSPMLGRRTRTGPWDEQIRSTYRLVQEAIDAGEWDCAAQPAPAGTSAWRIRRCAELNAHRSMRKGRCSMRKGRCSMRKGRCSMRKGRCSMRKGRCG